MNIYQQFFEKFSELFEKKYGSKFYPQRHHYKMLKDFLEPDEFGLMIPLDEVYQRLPIYFKDGFFEKCKHNPVKFFEHFHRFIPPGQTQKKTYPCEACKQRFETYEIYLDHKCPNAVPHPQEFINAVNQLTSKTKI